jgi:hypothetical protein
MLHGSRTTGNNLEYWLIDIISQVAYDRKYIFTVMFYWCFAGHVRPETWNWDTVRSFRLLIIQISFSGVPMTGKCHGIDSYWSGNKLLWPYVNKLKLSCQYLIFLSAVLSHEEISLDILMETSNIENQDRIGWISREVNVQQLLRKL